MKYVKPTLLSSKLSYEVYFIPITINDFNVIKPLMQKFCLYENSNNKDAAKNMYIENLPDTLINFHSTIRYIDIIALGTTEYNKKICEEIIESYTFRDKSVTWKCFDNNFKAINYIPYWKTARYGIHHVDCSCAWKCLMYSTGIPTHGLIIKVKSQNDIKSE